MNSIVMKTKSFRIVAKVVMAILLITAISLTVVLILPAQSNPDYKALEEETNAALIPPLFQAIVGLKINQFTLQELKEDVFHDYINKMVQVARLEVPVAVFGITKDGEEVVLITSNTDSSVYQMSVNVSWSVQNGDR